MTQLIITASAVLLSYAVLPAYGASISSKAIGVFQKNGAYSQTVKITPARGGGEFFGSFEVATRGCVGSVKMRGTAVGPNSVLFEKRDPTMEPQVCRISVNYGSDFGSIKVSHEYCGYSGAACDFNGTLKRKGR